MGYKESKHLVTVRNLSRMREWLDVALSAIQRTLTQKINGAESRVTEMINQTNSDLQNAEDRLNDRIDNIEVPDIPELPSDVRIYSGVNGTQAVTSSPYYATRYDVTDSTVSSYKPNMVVFFKTPCAGHGTYGTALQINNLGYKPVIYGYDKMIGTRYAVGDMIVAIYDSTQTASLYLGHGKVNVNGVWRVLNYGKSREQINDMLGYNRGTRTMKATMYSKMLCVVDVDGCIVPLNSRSNTGTTKPMTILEFLPQKGIFYYPEGSTLWSGNNLQMYNLCRQYSFVQFNYSFNCGSTLVANKEIYLVMVPQQGGTCKLAPNPWSQSLPKNADGKLYMLIGAASTAMQGELYAEHPIFWHDGKGIKLWTGGEAGMQHGNNMAVETNSVDVVFSGSRRNTKMLTASGNISISIKIDSSYSEDNILWVKNTGSSEIEITAEVYACEDGPDYVGQQTYLPSAGISVPAGHVCELKVIVTFNGAFITSNDLAQAE